MFALYKKGFTHVVKAADGTDVQCEIVRVEYNQIEDFLKAGYTQDIEDLRDNKSEVKKDKPLTKKQEKVEEIKKAVDESNSKLDAPVKKEVLNSPVEPNGKDEDKDPDHA